MADIAASVLAKLKNKAKASGISYQQCLQLFFQEEFLRRLFFIEKSGLVSDFNLVLDLKATNKTIKLWSFLIQVIDRTYLADNHSKLLLVRSLAGDTVSVITSQNLTRGNRYESAFITTDKEIFYTLHAQVQDLITNHSVPLHDLYRQRLAED